MAGAERWATGMPGPAYAIDDQAAIRVVDGTVDVVSEGHWRGFAPAAGFRSGAGVGRQVLAGEGGAGAADRCLPSL